MGCCGSKEGGDAGGGGADADDAPPKNLENDMVEQEVCELGVESADEVFKNCADVANKCAKYGGELMEKILGLQASVKEKAAAATPGGGGEREVGHGEPGDLKESLMTAMGNAPDILAMMKKKIPDSVFLKAQELAATDMTMSPTLLIKKLMQDGDDVVVMIKDVMPKVDLADLKEGVLKMELPDFDLGSLGDGARALWDLLVDFVMWIIDFATHAIGEMVTEMKEAYEAVSALSFDDMKAEFEALELSPWEMMSKAKDFKSNLGIGSKIKEYGEKLFDMIMMLVGHLQRFFNMIVGKCMMMMDKE